MFARLFRRSLLLSLLLVAVAQAQTSTLTPSQAAAISTEETRWNTQDLGAFSYGSITYSVVSVAPAKKGTFTPQPAPGTVAVQVVEHLTGGKSKSPGFQPTTYWLLPDGAGGWKTGYYQNAPHGSIFLDRGEIYPTEQAARERFTGPVKKPAAPLLTVNNLQAVWVIGAGVLVVLGLVTAPLWLGIISLKKQAVPSMVVCPGCRTENFPTPSACANCGSSNTVLREGKDKKGYRDIVTVCRNCKGRTKFDPYCVVCETDLTRQMLDGYGKVMG